MLDFCYVGYRELAEHIRAWEPHIPQISAVSGMPRSGLSPAQMLANHRNIPYIPIESLMTGSAYYNRPKSREANNVEGPVLILDDTHWTGKTLAEYRPRLSEEVGPILHGAVYVQENEAKKNGLDVWGYTLPHINHSFEWNLLKDMHCTRAVVDLDGILAHDWGRPDEGQHLNDYIHFLENAKVLIRPEQPLFAIVTARLTKYRELTEKWLKRNGIRYRHLVMSPYRNGYERMKNKGFGEWKADQYTLMAKGNRVLFFLESEAHQAKVIAQATGKPVICYETQQCHNGAKPVPAFDNYPAFRMSSNAIDPV